MIPLNLIINLISLIAIFSVNIGFENSVKSSQFYGSDSPILQDSIPLQRLIKKEINQTQTRFNPILHTWILAAILVPTSATLCVLVLAFKLGQKVKPVSDNITATHSQTQSQMKSLLSQEQNLTNTMNLLVNETHENIQKLQNKIQDL